MVEHRMLYEIKEQPEIIRRLAANKDSAVMLEAVKAIKQAQDERGNVYLVGNGSSYHACVYGQFILSRRGKLVTNLRDSSEFGDFAENLTERDIVIVVSQSGETGDATKLIPKIKTKNPKIIVITNYPESTLGQAADVAIPMEAGSCQAIPNTKGYTATIAIFAILADCLIGNESFSAHANSLARDIERIIQTEYDRLVAIADRLSTPKNIFVLGHDSGLSNAYETALKIKECAHIEAEGYSALEFRHGHSSVITTGTPVIVFMADYESEADLGSLLDEIGQPDPYIIGIGSVEHKQYDERFDAYEHGLYAAIAAMVPMQILAYELAVSRGINPDEPSRVSKIVKSL